jgi:hypothetical protein
MSIRGWQSSGRAALFLIVALAIVFGMGRVFAVPSWLPLYGNRFIFTPGDWLAWKISLARRTPDTTCVLVGASTVREGFDTAVLERLVPGTRFVNLGTTGSNSTIDTIEIGARALVSQGDHYRCIVVGLHPIFLHEFDTSAYELVTSDYTAVLPLKALFDLTVPPWKLPDLGVLLYKYLMPLGEHSLAINRLARISLYSLHTQYVDPATPKSEFEVFQGEFSSLSTGYMYSGPSMLKSVESKFPDQMKKTGWDNPEAYGGKTEARALQHSLEMLSSLTKRLVLVDMPESYLLRDIDKFARPPFEQAILSSGVKADVIRCTFPADSHPNVFHDDLHLNEQGRATLSVDLARFLTESKVEFSSAQSECAAQER